MTEQQIRRIRKWWHAYVRRFDAGDADLRRNMRLKEAHTLRVYKEAALIGRALKISPEDLRLTEALVLLHDVGRFAQYARYRTFADRLSGESRIARLENPQAGKSAMPLSALPSQILRRAIRYHNQAEIPPVRDRRLRFFARLLRDADKLDIWRLMIDYSNSPPGRKNHAIAIGLLEGKEIRRSVMEDLRAQRIVARRNVKPSTTSSCCNSPGFLTSITCRRSALFREGGTLRSCVMGCRTMRIRGRLMRSSEAMWRAAERAGIATSGAGAILRVNDSGEPPSAG